MPLTRFHHLAIDDSLPPPTDAELKSIENALGVTLPSDFTSFLAVANGGYLDYEVEVPHPEGFQRMGFSGLFATRPVRATEEAWGTFLFELEASRRSFQLPAAVLPIARDGGGSLLFLDLSPEGCGRVVSFVHGKPAWAGLAQADAFVEIAPTFSAYVEKLYIPEDQARELIDDAIEQQDLGRLTAIREWLEIGMPDWKQRLGPQVCRTLGES